MSAAVGLVHLDGGRVDEALLEEVGGGGPAWPPRLGSPAESST
jgi:hypothetical protein